LNSPLETFDAASELRDELLSVSLVLSIQSIAEATCMGHDARPCSGAFIGAGLQIAWLTVGNGGALAICMLHDA
jgi:hypothetical protein